MALLFVVPLTGDELSTELASESAQKMEQFKAAHPDARFFGRQYFDDEGFFEQIGSADFVHGTAMATGNSPIESAQNFYSQIEGIYANEAGEMVPGTEIGAMWDKVKEEYRFKTFRFQQTVAGIPVYRSGVGFLVRNEANYPVVMSSNNLKELEGFDAAAGAFVPAKATPAMIQNTSALLNESGPYQGAAKVQSVMDKDDDRNQKPLPTRVSEEQLVVWSGVSNIKVEPEFAIAFLAERGNHRQGNTYQRHIVIAAVDNGEILYSENQVVADVNGTVSGRATDSDRALECDAEVAFGLPYAEIEIVGGNSVFADVNGDFNIPDGSNGNVTVRSPLRGQFFFVEDDTAGGAVPSMDINVAAPGSVDVLHNPKCN